MKKIFTSLLVALALCTAIIAAVRTELRMHVFSNGDNGMNMVKALAEGGQCEIHQRHDRE